MTDRIERRAVPRPVTLRAAPEGRNGPGILTGYGAVFNSRSRDLGGFVEEIDPRAFGEPDAEGRLNLETHVRVIARTNHNSDLLLGTTDAGTLRLFIDNIGLRYEVDLPDTSYARDLAVLADREDIRFSSFAFRTAPKGDTWRESDDGLLVRRVVAARVYDVAPVADPAYWDATSTMQRDFDLDAIRASLTPQPSAPGEREKTAADVIARRMNRETHPALAKRPRKRGI